MKRFKQIIKKSWWIFLIYFLVCFFVVDSINKSITRDKEDETLFIFVATNDIDNENFYKYINSIKDPYLKKVTYRYVKNEAFELEQIYNTTLLSWCDIVILPESKIITNKLDYFINIDLNKANNYFNNQSYYVYNDKNYGIKLYDNASKNGKLTSYLEYGNEDYYIFLRANSLHMGDLNSSNYYGGINFIKKIYENN